jgi:hypothetical protein
VRFDFAQVIGARRDVVEAAYVDPAFYEELGRLPDLGVREVLDRSESDRVVRLRVRFAFTGQVSGAARAVVDPARLTWVTVSTTHLDEHRTTFEMIPDHYPDRLRCQGSYRFEEAPGADGAATRQLVEGDLSVRVPLVGRKVERAIVSGLRDNFGAQAALLEDRGA